MVPGRTVVMSHGHVVITGNSSGVLDKKVAGAFLLDVRLSQAAV